AHLFFGLMCLAVVTRILLTDNMIISEWVEPNWKTMVRIEYLATHFGFMAFLLFHRAMFLSRSSDTAFFVLLSLVGLSILVDILFPVKLITSLLFYFLLMMMSIGIYVFIASGRAVIQREQGAILFVIGYLILFVTMVNDMFLVMGLSHGPELFKFGIVGFIFIENFLIAKRFNQAFNATELLKEELFLVTKNQENTIEERTRELNEKNKYLEKTNIAIAQQNLELEKLHKEMDSFVYSVSHDLRAPIASVLGLIDVARHASEKKELDEIRSMEENSLKRMDSYIRDILDFSKNRNLDIEIAETDIEGIIEEIFQQNVCYTCKNRVKYSVEGSNPDKERFYSDYVRLKILLNNLINNAFKYADYEKKEQTVQVRYTLDPSRLKLSVVDNGMGIEEEYIDRIFNMYFRANTTLSGSGLGLYIAAEIVEKLSGQIKVKSKPGVGTVVELELPNNPGLIVQSKQFKI
ncbi:MAG: ATP-binding protein, partial [Cyclobacteriaceae bacterium]|nr:ATP-binding protein [Cyclobacteriaceae bacterium]